MLGDRLRKGKCELKLGNSKQSEWKESSLGARWDTWKGCPFISVDQVSRSKEVLGPG